MGDLSCEALEKNPNAILICPAMVKGSLLESAFNTYPERCFDMGISEEHAGVFTGAITLQGIHPILCMYSTFLQRAYDEIFHDCARIHADMTLLVDRVGLIGKNGETHMGIYDVAFLRSIPNVIITMPSTLSEARVLMDLSMEKGHGVFAIRYLGVFESLKETEKKEQGADTFSNSLGDLKKDIEYLIGMERQSGSMDVITPLYVSRMLNVPLEKVEKVMRGMNI